MPCICYGAVSGDEAFDDLKKRYPDHFEAIMTALMKAEFLIRSAPYSDECFKENWQKKWVKCFEHLVCGCPEKKEI